MTPEQTGRHLLGPALVTRLQRHLAPPLLEDLCQLVAAVAEQEREACAMAAWNAEERFVDDHLELQAQRRECARAIRARGTS